MTSCKVDQAKVAEADSFDMKVVGRTDQEEEVELHFQKLKTADSALGVQQQMITKTQESKKFLKSSEIWK